MHEPEPVGNIVIASSVPGVKDLVISLSLNGMRQLARAALNRVRELEAYKGCPQSCCGMCGQKVRVG